MWKLAVRTLMWSVWAICLSLWPLARRLATRVSCLVNRVICRISFVGSLQHCYSITVEPRGVLVELPGLAILVKLPGAGAAALLASRITRYRRTTQDYQVAA